MRRGVGWLAFPSLRALDVGKREGDGGPPLCGDTIIGISSSARLNGVYPYGPISRCLFGFVFVFKYVSF